MLHMSTVTCQVERGSWLRVCSNNLRQEINHSFTSLVAASQGDIVRGNIVPGHPDLVPGCKGQCQITCSIQVSQGARQEHISPS